MTATFKAVIDEDVINKAYLDDKLSKVHGHLSFLEKEYNEFKLDDNKQSVEEISVQGAVKTTIQILFDENLFDNSSNADEVLKDFLFATRRKGDLQQSK